MLRKFCIEQHWSSSADATRLHLAGYPEINGTTVKAAQTRHRQRT